MKESMPKVLVNDIPAREKKMVRISPHLHSEIKVLAAVSNAEIGILTDKLIQIGLEQFKQNRVVA